CLPNGVFGDCTDGAIVPKSFSSISTIHTSALATSSAVCGGGTTENSRVWTGGRDLGGACTKNSDFNNGKRKCQDDDDNDGDRDCNDHGKCRVTCGRFDGHCQGGLRNNRGCNLTGFWSCPGGTCQVEGGGGTCGTYTGVCNTNGPEDGDVCN